MSRSLFSALAAAVTVSGLAAVVCLSRLVGAVSVSRRTLLAGALLLAYGAALVLRPSPWPAIDLAVLAGATGGVLLIESGLQTQPAVAVFLAVAAVVDLLSFSGGFTHILVERYRAGSGSLLLYLSLDVPVRGHAIPIVGIGDLLVGGAAAAALLRLGLRPAAVMSAIIFGLLSALAYGLWRGGAPALPFIAVAVFFLVWRQRSATGVTDGT
ncbi:MAG TPA: hypothetical protein VIN93_14900 [Bryobacteraceae bacterium]|jgi:hypothetical protein